MDTDTITRGIVTAVDAHRKQMVYDNDWASHFELRVHPDDVRELRMTASKYFFNLDAFLAQKGVLGIPFVEDTEVEPGHPKLKSTWEWVL